MKSSSAIVENNMDLPENLKKVLADVNKAIRARRSVLLIGKPGCGKTMVARRAGFLPHELDAKYQEISAIQRMSGLENNKAIPQPFRAPHHTVSVTGLVGNGKHFRPGELSLAHGGVLFLDEVDEFPRRCLEAVAHAYEHKCVEFGLNSQWLRGLPADFALIGAMSIPDVEALRANEFATPILQGLSDRKKRVVDILGFDVVITL